MPSRRIPAGGMSTAHHHELAVTMARLSVYATRHYRRAFRGKKGEGRTTLVYSDVPFVPGKPLPRRIGYVDWKVPRPPHRGPVLLVWSDGRTTELDTELSLDE